MFDPNTSNGALNIINVIVFIIGMIVMVIGIVIMPQKEKYIDCSGTVTGSSCINCTGLFGMPPKHVTRKEAVTYNYIIDDKNYSSMSTTSRHYSRGDTISLSCDPTNPNNISVRKLSNSATGISLIVVGCVMIIGYTGYNIYSQLSSNPPPV